MNFVTAENFVVGRGSAWHGIALLLVSLGFPVGTELIERMNGWSRCRRSPRVIYMASRMTGLGGWIDKETC